MLAEDGEKPEHAYALYIAAEVTKHPQANQALVYYQHIKQGKTIASQLHTAMYHGKLPLRTKAKLLASFTRGEMQVMVATNAMGLPLQKVPDRGSIGLILCGGRNPGAGSIGLEERGLDCFRGSFSFNCNTYRFIDIISL